jgi:hypothetical protein
MHEPSVSKDNRDTNWRWSLIRYMQEPGGIIDRKICRQALKYALLDGELYR